MEKTITDTSLLNASRGIPDTPAGKIGSSNHVSFDLLANYIKAILDCVEDLLSVSSALTRSKKASDSFKLIWRRPLRIHLF
jgi:hypothetical protein